MEGDVTVEFLEELDPIANQDRHERITNFVSQPKAKAFSGEYTASNKPDVTEFHGKRHPTELGEEEITEFLSDLAVNRHVAASTQNQALSALLFLYQQFFQRKLGRLDTALRATRPPRVPVVLTRGEVRSLLAHVAPPYRLIADLIYGSGLRLLEAYDSGSKTSISATAASLFVMGKE